MGYTIRNFIESNKFPGIQLVSNNSGVNKEIQGVRSITVPNMENFLGGWVAPNFFDGLWKTQWTYAAKSSGRIK